MYVLDRASLDTHDRNPGQLKCLLGTSGIARSSRASNWGLPRDWLWLYLSSTDLLPVLDVDLGRNGTPGLGSVDVDRGARRGHLDLDSLHEFVA